MRVVGFVRVSTHEQHLGPEAQQDALRRWCDANGAELVATFEDMGVSGGAAIDKRVGLLAALGALRENDAGVLLVAKRDRLARDTVLAAMIERLAEREGARILAADGTGNGDGPEALLMRRLVDAFAEYERALIRARTKAALAIKRSRGENVGGVPIGQRLSSDGRNIEPAPTEQAAVKQITALRRRGLSIRSIAKNLNTDNVPARGRQWYATTVARVLDRTG